MTDWNSRKFADRTEAHYWWEKGFSIRDPFHNEAAFFSAQSQIRQWIILMEKVRCCMLSAVLSLSLPRYLLVQSELPTLPLIQSPAGARMSEFRRVSYLCAITLLQPSCLQPSVTSNTLVTSIHLLHMHQFDLVQWQWKAEKAKKTFPLISKSSHQELRPFFFSPP